MMGKGYHRKKQKKDELEEEEEEGAKEQREGPINNSNPVSSTSVPRLDSGASLVWSRLLAAAVLLFPFLPASWMVMSSSS